MVLGVVLAAFLFDLFAIKILRLHALLLGVFVTSLDVIWALLLSNFWPVFCHLARRAIHLGALVVLSHVKAGWDVRVALRTHGR